MHTKFSNRGDFVKMMGNLCFMVAGAGLVIMYNIYEKPIKNALKQKVKCTCKELEDIM